jgi:hypothetical protein
MKLKLFEQFIAEGAYPTLSDYLEKYPNIKSRLSPTGTAGTHMISGTYFDRPQWGMASVDLKLLDNTTGAPVTKANGQGAGTGPDKVTEYFYSALTALSAKITDPKITISSGQFPLAPGVTIDGVKTSLDKTV